jgi:hypothetical protein
MPEARFKDGGAKAFGPTDWPRRNLFSLACEDDLIIEVRKPLGIWSRQINFGSVLFSLQKWAH